MSRSFGGRVSGWVKLSGLSLLTVVCVPTASAGQESLSVKLLFSAGTIDAHGDLQDAPILAEGPAVLSYGALPARASLGFGVEVAPTGFPIALRAGVARSLPDERTGQWRCSPSSEPQPCPAVLIEVPTEMTTTLGTADLVASIPVRRAALHPLVGVTWVRHDYQWDPTSGSFSLESGEFRHDSAALRLGFGVSAPLGPARILAEYAQLHSGSDPARPDRVGTTTLGVLVPIM